MQFYANDMQIYAEFMLILSRDVVQMGVFGSPVVQGE